MSDDRAMKRAELLIEAGRLDAALELLLPLLATGGSTGQEYAHLLVMQALLQKDDNRQAIHYGEQAIGKGYDSARIRAALACAYIGSSLPLKALEQLDIALDKAPDHAFAHYLKAIAHLHRRAVHSAEKSIQAALALEPDDADYIGCLAEVRYFQNRGSESRRHLDEALAIDPENCNLLLISADRTSALPRKQMLLERVLRQHPTDPYVQKAHRTLTARRRRSTLLLALLIAPLVAGLFLSYGGNKDGVALIILSLVTGYLLAAGRSLQIIGKFFARLARRVHFHYQQGSLRHKADEFWRDHANGWTLLIVIGALIAGIAERGGLPVEFRNALFGPLIMLIYHRMRHLWSFLFPFLIHLLLGGVILSLAGKHPAVALGGGALVVVLQSVVLNKWYLSYFK